MQQQIKIIEAYFAAKSVLLSHRQCRKDFGRKSVPDGRTMQHLLAKFQKTESVADAHKCHEERHEKSPRKSTGHLSEETSISRKSLKLFPYKIQILQRKTDQNRAERETFCEDIIQRIENDPGLLDQNDLNDVNQCGLCEASAILAVS